MKLKEEDLNLKKTGGTMMAFLREAGIVLGTFLLLNSFVLASFEVPTGSMENEIMTGDFLLVNKFEFGGTTPRTIPFTNTKLPSFKLPSPWKVERGDVIVFIFPGYREEVEASEFAYYLKRCMALAGDTLQIINRVVYVNGKAVPLPRNSKFNSPMIKPAGFADPHIFPKGSGYNEDNYGPIVIPKKGDVVNLKESNYERWDTFIRREGHTFQYVNGKFLIDGLITTSYTIEGNYAFGMGDNRDNSLDSRFWGFIPQESIIGSPMVVYWSWDPDVPLLDFDNPISLAISVVKLPITLISDKLPTVRWGRFGNLVK